MLNPLTWKSEHRAGLGAAAIVGAVLGVAVGFEMTHWKGLTLSHWISVNPDDALAWAVIGAIAAAAAIYSFRAFAR